MTGHYDIYKVKVEALKKAGVDKQHNIRVKKYLENECNKDYSDPDT